MNSKPEKGVIRVYRVAKDPENIVIEVVYGARVRTLYAGSIEPDTCVVLRNLTIVTPQSWGKTPRMN